MALPNPPSSTGIWKHMALSRRAWWLIAAAFGVGMLLFVFIWAQQREEPEFFRASTPTAPGNDGQTTFEPLPTPEAAGNQEEEGPGFAPAQDGAQSQAGNDGSLAPPPMDAQQPPPLMEAPVPAAPGTSAGSTSPVPVVHPAPRYPSRALRSGDTGTVLLQVHVDVQGHPARVDVVQSSHSRELDREARRAVEQWRFRPATRAGQPVAGKVLIPIDFKPGQ